MKKAIFLIFILCLLGLLTACSSAQQNIILGTPMPSPTETLLPQFALDAQEAQAQAQITKSAAEAQIVAASVQLTLAVATEQYLNRQTQTAGTSTAEANASATAAAGDHLTATVVANQNAVSASNTQIAMTQTAVPNNATATAIWYAGQETDRQNRSAENTLWFTTWAFRLALALIFVAGFVFAIFGAKAVYEARYAILAQFGVVRWGNDGKPYIIAPVKGGLHIWDPSRALDPGVTIIAADHQLTTGGGAADRNQQFQLAQHAQTIEYKLGENTHSGQPQSALPGAPQAVPGPQSLAAKPAPAQLPENPDIKILVVDSSQVQAWVDEATGQIIDGEVTDI